MEDIHTVIELNYMLGLSRATTVPTCEKSGKYRLKMQLSPRFASFW